MIQISEVDFQIFIRALKFAAIKHRDQRRKDPAGTPYINHPIQVAETLWSIGQVRDITVLSGAILHDTIEDTATTPQEIEAEFGSEICSLVLEVTDDKSLEKKERKRLQVVNAPHKSKGAQQIKLADKICNVIDISKNPPTSWPWSRRWEYLDWTEKVVAGMRGANPALEAYYDSILSAGRSRLLQERSPNARV